MRALGPYVIGFLLGAAIMWITLRSWERAQEPALGKPADKKLELVLVDGAEVTVTRVIDGDTVVLENGMLVRYRGVNAPESGHFIKDPSPMAVEATDRNRQLVEGKRVKLQLGNPSMDAYGRVIARLTVQNVKVEESDVESLLLKEGLARILPLGLSAEDTQRFKQLETEAKQNKRGIWGVTDPFAEGKAKDFQYCAAANSRVFHHVESPVAHRISAANFVGYKTLEDAVCSGRAMSTTSIKYLKKKLGLPSTEEPKEFTVEDP